MIGRQPVPMAGFTTMTPSLISAVAGGAGNLTPWGAVSSGVSSIADIAKAYLTGTQASSLAKQQADLQNKQIEAARQAQQSALTA